MLIQKISRKIFAFFLTTICFNPSFLIANPAGNLWNFEKSERIFHFIPNPEPNEGNLFGINYTCNSFSPNYVSLLIFYQGKSPIISANPEAFIHNKALNKNPLSLEERGFMLVKNLSKMSLVLSFGSKYHISNFTGIPIQGLDCSSQEISH
ncbi:hypothetical protein QEJ31_03115 [Pigmentibacter sp. JX0631]|uniref:hypothetical protein n=1 Tax=Pigmentibacter sp. JX0631 TaxID=2976982 RepID=UPI002468E9C8|nr:hypothetical protein [Pigmentibacter sp. JX0631]WGL60591.1 hypothetical protein QEJ31_03115 [Pigmentibacter sp. JX0631]